MHLGAGVQCTLDPGRLASNCWNWKGGTNFQSKLPWVLNPWDGNEFCPPLGHVHLVGLPIQPGFNILDGRLWQVTPPTFGILAAMGLPGGCAVSCPWVEGGTLPLFSKNILERCPCSSIWSLLRVWLYLWFPKGYPPLLSRPTRGPQSSVQRLTLQVATTVAAGAGTLDTSQP